jgi:hypothetical protein
MKKIQITKRDAKFFFLGVFVMFLISLLLEWQDVKAGFRDGLKDKITEKDK